LPPMLTKYQSGERSFRLYFLLVRFLCTSKENEQQTIPNQLPFLRILTNNPKDHLGSASWITGITAQYVKHLCYLPFGEEWLNQRNTTIDYTSRYTFSGKERDSETGYSYFGARYYSSDYSIWLSVDPLSDKYPSMSPYMYCAGNRVMSKSTEQLIFATNTEYEQGKVAELTIFSHGYPDGVSLGGQTANEFEQNRANDQFYYYDLRELNASTIGQINTNNFTENATINFLGCKIGGGSKWEFGNSFAQIVADYMSVGRIVNIVLSLFRPIKAIS